MAKHLKISAMPSINYLKSRNLSTQKELFSAIQYLVSLYSFPITTLALVFSKMGVKFYYGPRARSDVLPFGMNINAKSERKLNRTLKCKRMLNKKKLVFSRLCIVISENAFQERAITWKIYSRSNALYKYLPFGYCHWHSLLTVVAEKIIYRHSYWNVVEHLKVYLPSRIAINAN